MAKNVNNPFLAGHVGKIAGFIYRRRGNSTHVYKAPLPSGKKPSKAQLENRLKFKKAVKYAAKVKRTPALRARYTKKMELWQNINNLAIKDFLKAPRILSFDTKNYKGQPGDKIFITPQDDFAVAKLTISIFDPHGNLVEKGKAFSERGVFWEYCATVINEQWKGSTISMKVFDLPGNEGVADTIV
ncbi:hypothetical protein [Flavihumibacter sp.]|uniref:hypothetical protein n=1 Tax=Flavihumibacter sp. TaxID=1913981 RepID=UPI002FCB6ADE